MSTPVEADNDEESGGAPAGIQSVGIGLDILATLGNLGGAQQLSTLAKACGMSRTKAYRYLVSLERSGFVEREPATSRYVLGARSLHVGLAALAEVDFVRIASGALPELCQDLQQTVFLSIWTDQGPTIVRWEDAGQQITVNVRVGSRMPLLSSATGEVFGAFLPTAITKKLVEKEIRSGLAREQGIRTWGDAEKLFHEVRKVGLGRALGRMLPGIEALSVPVFEFQGNLAGAITCLGLRGGFDGDVNGPIGTQLRHTASRLSFRLGHAELPHRS
jgi:DNA-binding IclR family transcriptional regulator